MWVLFFFSSQFPFLGAIVDKVCLTLFLQQFTAVAVSILMRLIFGIYHNELKYFWRGILIFMHTKRAETIYVFPAFRNVGFPDVQPIKMPGLQSAHLGCATLYVFGWTYGKPALTPVLRKKIKCFGFMHNFHMEENNENSFKNYFNPLCMRQRKEPVMV